MDPTKNKILLTNLSANTTHHKINGLFKKFGKIAKVYIVRKDPEGKTWDCSGKAYIAYESAESAAKAVEEMNGEVFDDSIIMVDFVSDQEYLREVKVCPKPNKKAEQLKGSVPTATTAALHVAETPAVESEWQPYQSPYLMDQGSHLNDNGRESAQQPLATNYTKPGRSTILPDISDRLATLDSENPVGFSAARRGRAKRNEVRMDRSDDVNVKDTLSHGQSYRDLADEHPRLKRMDLYTDEPRDRQATSPLSRDYDPYEVRRRQDDLYDVPRRRDYDLDRPRSYRDRSPLRLDSELRSSLSQRAAYRDEYIEGRSTRSVDDILRENRYVRDPYDRERRREVDLLYERPSRDAARDVYREPTRLRDDYLERATGRAREEYREPVKGREDYLEPAVGRNEYRQQGLDREPVRARDERREPALPREDYQEPARAIIDYGKPARARADYGEPARARADYGEPARSIVDYGEPARARADYGDPARARADYGEPARARVDYGEPARARADYGEPARARADYGEPARADYGEPARARADYGEPARARAGADYGEPARARDDYGEPVRARADYGELSRAGANYREPAVVREGYREQVRHDYREPAMADYKAERTPLGLDRPTYDYSLENTLGADRPSYDYSLESEAVSEKPPCFTPSKPVQPIEHDIASSTQEPDPLPVLSTPPRRKRFDVGPQSEKTPGTSGSSQKVIKQIIREYFIDDKGQKILREYEREVLQDPSQQASISSPVLQYKDADSTSEPKQEDEEPPISKRFPIVWIMGDSYVSRAAKSVFLSSMGLQDIVELHWKVLKEDELLADFRYSFESLLKSSPEPPSLVVLHLGAYDIVDDPHKGFMSSLKDVLRTTVDKHGIRVAWSEILPQLDKYGNQINRKGCIHINDMAKEILVDCYSGNHVIKYPEIRPTPLFMESGMLALTNRGNGLFIKRLKEAVRAFITNKNICTFP